MATLSPVAQTRTGKVQGEERDGVYIYRGIPYGGDCGPGHRFMAPVPAESWEGIRDCTKNGPISVQLGESVGASAAFHEYFGGGHPELQGVIGEQQGENCLVLNVLTPGLDKEKRPVLVYIHGGGFTTNSGSIMTGGDRLVREENIVAVSMNHRLNAFGYLYLGDLDPKYKDSGNAGMLDLILALRWVKDNIAYFGGDPDNVTLMGESGGGMKISTLLAMDEAKGLFHRAIIESGSSVVGVYSKEMATKAALEFLERAGVSPEHLDEIQTLPVEKLKEAIGFGLGGYEPVADGIHLMPNESGKFNVYPSAKGVPIMIGASLEEMAAFVPTDKFNITWDNLKKELTTPVMLGGAPMTEEQAEGAIAVLKKENPEITPDHIYMTSISQMSFLGNGAHRQAEVMAAESGAPVYYYLITKGSPFRDTEVTDHKYSWHTADLPLQMRIVAHPEQEELSRTFGAMWAAFARTGNPSIKGYEWPAFTLEKKTNMVFGDEIGAKDDPIAEINSFFDQLV